MQTEDRGVSVTPSFYGDAMNTDPVASGMAYQRPSIRWPWINTPWSRKPPLHYSCVWEDADVLCAALQPVALGRRLLSISSAGDNALALLTLEPSEVAAIDIDPTQLAALDLRSRAFEALDHDDVLVFLGVREGHNRATIYRTLRSALSRSSREFWDNVPNAIQAGIIHCGRFERYMRWFRCLLPQRTRAAMRRLADANGSEERSRIFDEEYDGLLWRTLSAVAFAPRTISTFDKRRPYLDRASSDVVEMMRRRLKNVLTAAPWNESSYLTYFFTGNYGYGALPLYLRPEHHDAIRSGISRLSIHNVDLADSAVLGRFSGFNLSNVLDYNAPDSFGRTYRGVLSAAEPGARLVYWSASADSQRPTGSTCVQSVAEAKRLQERDRVGAYESFHIDEVCAPI
ncbi:MAG: DUF3419 family protein [Betaproteobacteria bacterium]|nr:DUF3419 family protein [Betaproteobacteria bacterium]